MRDEWLLVFLWFNGHVYASGPHNLQACSEMLAAYTGPAACVQKDHPTRRAAEKKATPASAPKDGM